MAVIKVVMLIFYHGLVIGVIGVMVWVYRR
jgi:hypothetical protein